MLSIMPYTGFKCSKSSLRMTVKSTDWPPPKPSLDWQYSRVKSEVALYLVLINIQNIFLLKCTAVCINILLLVSFLIRRN